MALLDSKSKTELIEMSQEEFRKMETVFTDTIGRIAAIRKYMAKKFAGLDDASSILLLFLNNNELRPGGGFIGT